MLDGPVDQIARFALARKHARFIALLPAPQRGNLVADMVAGLYAVGGTAVYSAAVAGLASDLAAALRGRAGSGTGRRCRLAEHLLGPSLHRTSPALAAIYAWCLQYNSLCCRGLLAGALGDVVG